MRGLTKDVYITSVLNPNMRVFDVEMRTEFGTSYNSYVICGKEKIAVIDANHATFTDDWLEKVQTVLGERTPDFLILNHTEPDHSGAVRACLELYPEVTVVCSAPAAQNIKNITNMAELSPRVVKTGDSVDLGGLTLQFFSAPFLHWPDTMFTWLPERKTIFTCDFLGAHFCEPRLFDYKITHKSDYTTAFKEYYNAIMSPFASWVQKGLDILDPLDIEIVANSHGPVLTKGNELEKCMEHYREWSSPQGDGRKKITLFYCSAYGNTKKIGEHIASGIRKALPDAHVVSHNLVGADIAAMGAELNSSDAVLIGSPTINKTALPTVWNLLAHIDAVNIAKRPIALFGSYGWSGEALPQLAERLTALKAAVYEPQCKVRFVPSEDDLKAAEGFGEGFGEGL